MLKSDALLKSGAFNLVEFSAFMQDFSINSLVYRYWQNDKQSTIFNWISRNESRIEKLHAETQIDKKAIGKIFIQNSSSDFLSTKLERLELYTQQLKNLGYTDMQIVDLISRPIRNIAPIMDFLITYTEDIIEYELYTCEGLFYLVMYNNQLMKQIDSIKKTITELDFVKINTGKKIRNKTAKIPNRAEKEKQAKTSAPLNNTTNNLLNLQLFQCMHSGFTKKQTVLTAEQYASIKSKTSKTTPSNQSPNSQQHAPNHQFNNPTLNLSNHQNMALEIPNIREKISMPNQSIDPDHLITPDVLINEMISNIDDSIFFEEKNKSDLEKPYIPESPPNPISALDLQFDELFSVNENSCDENYPDQVASPLAVKHNGYVTEHDDQHHLPSELMNLATKTVTVNNQSEKTDNTFFNLDQQNTENKVCKKKYVRIMNSPLYTELLQMPNPSQVDIPPKDIFIENMNILGIPSSEYTSWSKIDLSRICCWVAKHVEAIKKIIDEQKINPKIIGIIIGNNKKSETLDKKFALLLQYAPKLIELQYSNDQIAALIFKQSRYQKEVLDLLIKNTAWLSIENKFYTHEQLVEIALSSKQNISRFLSIVHSDYPRLESETKKCSKRSELGASDHQSNKYPRLDAEIIEINDDIPVLSNNTVNVTYANTHLAGRLFADLLTDFQNLRAAQSQNTNDNAHVVLKK